MVDNRPCFGDLIEDVINLLKMGDWPAKLNAMSIGNMMITLISDNQCSFLLETQPTHHGSSLEHWLIHIGVPQQFRKLFGFDMPHRVWRVIGMSLNVVAKCSFVGIVMDSFLRLERLETLLVLQPCWYANTFLANRYRKGSMRASNDQTNRHVLNWDIPPVKKMMDKYGLWNFRFGCSSQP